MDSDIQTSLTSRDGGESVLMRLTAEAGGGVALHLIDLEGECGPLVVSVNEIEAW